MARWQRGMCAERRRTFEYVYELDAEEQLELAAALGIIGLDAWGTVAECGGNLREIGFQALLHIWRHGANERNSAAFFEIQRLTK